MTIVRRYALLVALVGVLVGVLVVSDAAWHRDNRADALTITLGLAPERQCALARPLVRIPIPGEWDLTCYRSEHRTLSWGETVYTDGTAREVDRINLYLLDGQSVQSVAELMAHEVAHGYIAGAHRGGDPSNDWVADHEPYADHFARCVTDRRYPC